MRSPSLASISGRISNFKQLTSTLATFNVGDIPCKAVGLAVLRIAAWANKPEREYEFEGQYVTSRFGQEFAVEHGRIKGPEPKQIEFYMDMMRAFEVNRLRHIVHFGANSIAQLEAAKRLLFEKAGEVAA
jgi:hypothetical protein